MGLLDMNFDDPATMGLLSAGLNMIGNSGRGSNMGTAQILAQGLGSGIEGYQGTIANKRALEAALLKQKHEDLLNTGLELQNRAAQKQFDDADAQRQAYMDFAKQRSQQMPQLSMPQMQQSQSQSMPQQSSPMQDGGMTPQNSSPQMSPQPPLLQPPRMPTNAISPLQSQINDLNAKADYFENVKNLSGQAFRDKAIELEKMKPKFATDFRIGTDSNNKLANFQLADNGDIRQSDVGVAPKMRELGLGGSTQLINENDYLKGQTFKHTMTPGEIANNANTQARLSFDKEQAAGDDSLGLSPEAIVNAAVRYNKTGIMPAMGNGLAGSLGRKAMLNKAAELSTADNQTAEQVAQAQLDNKGKALAMNKSLASFAAGGKDAIALQAGNTGLNHLATLKQLALAQSNGQVELFNKIANEFGKATGNPAPTNLDMALSMVSPEISKAVIGASGGQEERLAYEKKFRKNGSPEQILGSINTAEDLLGGRLTETKRTYERTTGKKDFSETMLSPAAQNVLNTRLSNDASSSHPKVASMQDIVDTARASGKTTAQVTSDLRAKGYTIGGK